MVVTSKEQLGMTLSLIQFKKFKFPGRQELSETTSTVATRFVWTPAPQLYILSEQQTPNMTGLHFLKVRRQISRRTASQRDLGVWGGNLIFKGI